MISGIGSITSTIELYLYSHRAEINDYKIRKSYKSNQLKREKPTQIKNVGVNTNNVLTVKHTFLASILFISLLPFYNLQINTM